ncbi:hypothetical protein CYMTET_6355, partial [Cymbomonas tetramitiformis]
MKPLFLVLSRQRTDANSCAGDSETNGPAFAKSSEQHLFAWLADNGGDVHSVAVGAVGPGAPRGLLAARDLHRGE